MTLKEEELQKAKEVATKFESELKEVSLKHTSVNKSVAAAITHLSSHVIEHNQLHADIIACN